jgi:hypothetical protein
MSMAIDPMIRIKLDQFIGRRRRWTIFYALLMSIFVWILGVLLFTWIDSVWILDRFTRLLLSLGTYAIAAISAIVIIVRRLGNDDPLIQAAVAIEKQRPELRDQLLSAVELSRLDVPSGSQSFIGALQKSVSGKIRAVDVRALLPLKQLRKPMAVAAASLLTCILLAFVPQLQFGNRFARAIIPGFDIDRVSRTKILIERPAPPSRPVPAEEITAIVVRLEGELAERATLQWIAEDGAKGKVEMHAGDRSATDNVDESQITFAANLMVHQTPVSYRILAGDGVTRWQQLEPRGRPEVVEFTTHLTPPSYSKLPSTTLVSSEGNIEALEGSHASLTLKFNMPVKEVEMRRMNSDRRVPLRQEGELWFIDTVISFDDRYQVLAKSAETGFDNPLSPQYTITPIEDAAPLVRWSQDLQKASTDKPRRELITPFSKLTLTALFSDDMPLERMFQEVSINGGEWTDIPLDAPAEETQFKREWPWDLQLLQHDGRELKAGDVVQTRAVAIDRNQSRGESAIKEFIISDHEFDAKKQEKLDTWIELSKDVYQWHRSVLAQLENLKIEAQRPAQANEPDSEISSIEKLRSDRDARDKRLGLMIDQAVHDSEAAKLERLARAMRRIEDALFLAAEMDEAKRKEQRWIKSHNDVTLDFVKAETAHQLGMVLYDNVSRMWASIQPTVRETDAVDWTTFSRYFEVTREQYTALAELIDKAAIAIPDSTRQHNLGLLRWIDQEQRRLEEAIIQYVSREDFEQTAAYTAADLLNHRQHGLLDGRLPSIQTESLKRLQSAIGWTRDSIKKMIPIVDDMANSQEEIGSNDSEKIRQANEEIASAMSALAKIRGEIVGRLQHETSLHRHRPEADQKYIADAHLLEQVLTRIAEDDFELPEGKTLRQVYESVAQAYQVLEASHEVAQWGRELRSLADDDRWNANSGAGKIDAPNRIERFNVGMEYSCQGLELAGLDWKDREPITSMRWYPLISTLYNEITARRWKPTEPISVADKLEQVCADFNSALQLLEPHKATARRTLQSLLPSIPELARKAADTLRESKLDESKDKKDEQTKKEEAVAQQKREEAEQKAEQLKERLTDEANTQELLTEEGRRKARNADISLQAIEQRMKELEEAAQQLEKAQSETSPSPSDAKAEKAALNEASDKAAETMEQIAKHYEQQDAEMDDPTKDLMPNSPSPLQQLEAELGLSKPLDEQFAKSESLANALNSDPRDLLKKLQQELKRNELMQKELDGIKNQALQEAQRALAEQASRERDLQLQLERSDPQLTVAKRELEESIRRAAEVGQELQRSLLSAASQAADAVRDLPNESARKSEEAKKALRETNQSLQEAIVAATEVGSADTQLLADLQEKAAAIKESFEEASQALAENDRPLADIMNDEATKLEDKRRNDLKRQMENIQKRARDNQLQMARDQQRRAAQRLQQAEQEAKNAQSRVKREEENFQKADDKQKREPTNNAAAAEARRLAAELEKAKDLQKASERGVEARKQTNETIKDRIDQISKTKLPELDQPHPALQLAKDSQSTASEQLKQASDQLDAAAKAAAATEPLQPSAESVAQAEAGQRRVAEDVAAIAENLARAARHEQRLGQMEEAQNTAAAAEAVRQISEGEVNQAAKSLAKAKQASDAAQSKSAKADPATAQAAREALNDSQSALQAQADLLAAMNQGKNGEADPNSESSDPSSQPSAQESAQQMARTLDDLDRSISAAQKSDQQGEGSDQEGEGSDSSPSSTLSEAARKQAQKMAMNRAQNNQQPSPSEGESPSSDATESGDGFSTAMADMFDLNSVERLTDSDWGKLRSREADDVAEERRVEISPEYRKQIEAYFRVIAEKGKE